MTYFMSGPSEANDPDREVAAFLLEYHRALKRGDTTPEPPPELRARIGPGRAAVLHDRMRALREHEERARALGDGPPDRDRFRIGARIGEGGMGVVYQAFDLHLGREVAVKFLRDGVAGVERFYDEARIAGALNHPSIVPVHDLVTDRDGRPCIVMTYVEGDTLRTHLGRLPAPRPPGAISDWLTVFEQIARTVAYAHDRGVLHRDLKSDNVKVGAAGQVWVLDWGLAKQLRAPGGDGDGDPGPAAGDPGGPPRRDATAFGAVLGTYHSMAPEQAGALPGPPDERTDVFGLGSILCEILTGAPAYTGTPDEVRALVHAADLGPTYARLDACGQDPDLVALARRCLQKYPDDRPRKAVAVAVAVADYRRSLETRARDAELAAVAAAEQARYEAKRRRTLARGLLALSAMSLLIAAATTWAWVANRRYVTMAGVTSDALRVVSRVAADERLLPLGLTDLQGDLLTQALPALEAYRRLAGGSEADALLSGALLKMASVYSRAGDSRKAIGALEAAERYFAGLAAEGGAHAPDAVFNLATTRASHGIILGQSRDRTAEGIRLLAAAADGYASLLKAGQRDPTELRLALASCRMNQANCLRLSEPGKAVDYYRQSLDGFRECARVAPDNARARTWIVKTGSNLGLQYELVGSLSKAVPVHVEAVRAGREFLARVDAARAAGANPERDPWLVHELGLRDGLALALYNLGALRGRTEQTGEALNDLRGALAIYQSLARADEKNLDAALGVAMARSEIAHILSRSGPTGWGEAAELLRLSGDWYRRAGKEHPEEADLARYRGVDLTRAAELEALRRAEPGADLRLAREAMAVLDRKETGDGPELRQALAEARTVLGDALARAGDRDAARESWDEARAGLEALVKEWPGVPRLVPPLARAEGRLAAVAALRGQAAVAATLRDQARRRLDDLRGRGCDDPAVAEVQAEIGAARPWAPVTTPRGAG